MALNSAISFCRVPESLQAGPHQSNDLNARFFVALEVAAIRERCVLRHWLNLLAQSGFPVTRAAAHVRHRNHLDHVAGEHAE
jgi:hypothetical protein